MPGTWRAVVGLGAAITLGAAIDARAQVAPCEASPPVRQAIKSISSRDLNRDGEVAAYRDLLKRYPKDLFVHERYQDSAAYPWSEQWDAVIAEYRGLAKAHPGDPLFEYLAARAAVGKGTKDVLPVLERVSARVPDAHLQLTRIYESAAFKDAPKARAHLEAFMSVCPTTFTPYQYLRSLEVSDFVKAATAKMRTLLVAHTDLDTANWYTMLWALEFRVRPVGEHDQVRKQVAEDLQRLRALKGTDTAYLYTLRSGYKQAGDKEGEQRTSEALAKVSYSAAYDLWQKDHPYPKPTDSTETTNTFYIALAAFTDEWARRSPDDVYIRFTQVSALTNLDGADEADVLRAGNGLLNAVTRNPGSMSFGSPTGGASFALVVAYLFATHGVAIDQLPGLVSQGIADNDKPDPSLAGRVDDLYPRPEPPPGEEESPYPWWGRTTAVDIWIKVKDAARARRAALELQTRLEGMKPKGDPKDTAFAAKQKAYMTRESEYFQRMGDLAVLEGHNTDAMGFYQNAIFARPTPPAGGAKDDLANRARALWTQTGGTNEGWNAWYTRRDLLGAAPAAAGGLSFTKAEKVLPAFELADLSAVKWHVSDFKGKATLVGIWATW